MTFIFNKDIMCANIFNKDVIFNRGYLIASCEDIYEELIMIIKFLTMFYSETVILIHKGFKFLKKIIKEVKKI